MLDFNTIARWIAASAVYRKPGSSVKSSGRPVNYLSNNLMHSRGIMDSEYNAPYQTFFPWPSMDPLKNKNKTLTHGVGLAHTLRDRDIIYDGITVLS